MTSEDVPSLPAASAFVDGRMSFDLISGKLEASFMSGPQNSRALVVWFRGAVDRSVAAPVFEVELKKAYSGWAHQIAITDPTLSCDNDMRIGWYIGHKSLDAQRQLTIFFARLRSVLNVDRVIYIGSSGGGFAGLYFSLQDEKSCVIAIEPQVRIGTYFYFPIYAEKAWAGRSQTSIHEERVTDLCVAYRKGFKNTVIYVQNTTDIHHVKTQMLPFLDAAYSVNDAKLICNLDFWGGFGHGLMPTQVVTRWLKSAVIAPSLRPDDILKNYHEARSEKSVQSQTTAPIKEQSAPDPSRITLADRIRSFQLREASSEEKARG